MSYLKSTSTGEVFPFNSHLAARSDMIECNADGRAIEAAPAPAPEKPATTTPSRSASRRGKSKTLIEAAGPAVDTGDVLADLES